MPKLFSRSTPPKPASLLRQSLTREHGFEPLRVEGDIPEELAGTLYRNGPGLYECFGHPYSHLFEGDGAVCALRLEHGRALGAHRVVVGEGLRQERLAQKPLYGFNAPWWRRVAANFQKKLKNTGNTSVVVWQDKLYALMEAALPIEISQADLATIGETDLGAVTAAFSAHPHEVPARRAIYNFGLRYGRQTLLDIYELPAAGRARLLHSVPLKYPVMLHDFIASERYLVFLVSPVKVNPLRAMLSIPPFEKLFRWDPREGTEVIVVPIDEPERTVRFHTDPFFQFHFANAFDVGDDIVVDFVRYKNFDVLSGLGVEEVDLDTSYVRATITPSTMAYRSEPLAKRCEFPRLHPAQQGREHSHVWMVSQSENPVGDAPDADQLVCLDIASGHQRRFQFADGQRTSEPVFVPRANEQQPNPRDGHVLSLVFDPASRTSYWAVFAAESFEDGPVARLWFDHHVPTTFHGVWAPASSA